MAIRPARPADFLFIQDLAARSFARLGDYQRVVPQWLETDGVSAFIAEERGEAVGFALVGFFRDDAAPTVWTADLLAIAVAPAAQSRGIGRRLLDHAIAQARAARRRRAVREMRLSVAEDNERARSLFLTAGFVEVPGDHGRYDRGQRAIHMRRTL
jgi:ribosomal protein S18 acetylase RimI-like enzyme